MKKKQEQLCDLAISESGFVFDPRTGGVFTVNQSGRVVLKLLQDGVASDQISARLTTVFAETDEQDMSRDLSEFLGVLREYRLLKETQREQA